MRKNVAFARERPLAHDHTCLDNRRCKQVTTDYVGCKAGVAADITEQECMWHVRRELSSSPATLVIAIRAGAMVIVAKIMLTLMLGIGLFFIAMLMFPVIGKWFES